MRFGSADLLPVLAVLVVSSIVVLWVQRRYSTVDGRLVAASWGAHILSALVQLWLVLRVYGVGDVLMYDRYGRDLSAAMRADPWTVIPQVFGVVLQQGNRLSVFVPADGQPTGSMVALTSLVHVVLGDSLLAAALWFSLLSFIGKLLLLETFRSTTPEHTHRALLFAVLFVPSAVFWSSGVIKEAVALLGIGLFVFGVHRTFEGRGMGLAMVASGAVVMGIVKPYILMGLTGASGVYLYVKQAARRGRLEVRPVPLLIGAGGAVAAFVLIGEIFPRFSLERLGEETARLQAASYNPKGGSTYVIGDPSQRSLIGQFAFAPFALLTALYRPFLFEAYNPQMVVNGIETLAFAGLTARAVWSRRLGTLGDLLSRYPIVAMCVSFVVVFGVAVGLTAANLGTLSRYRMPLVPFFAVFLVLVAMPPPKVARTRTSDLRARAA